MRPLIIAVLAAATASAACVDDNPGLVVSANVRPDSMCLLSATSVPNAYGNYDVAFPHAYFVAPLFRSGLVSRTAVAGAPRAETNDVMIQGAEVDITQLGGAAVPGIGAYTVSMNTFVPAGVDGDVGLATGLVEAIPAAYAPQLATLAPGGTATIVLTMSFFGRTTGGTDITTGPWSWTISVCTGCLLAACGTMITDTQCFAGQDGYVYLPAGCPVAP